MAEKQRVSSVVLNSTSCVITPNRVGFMQQYPSRKGCGEQDWPCQRQETQQELWSYSRNISASATASWCRGLLAVLITWFGYYLLLQEAFFKS